MIVNINLLSLALSPVLFYLGSAAFFILLTHLKLLNIEN